MNGFLPDTVDIQIAPAYGVVQPSTIPSTAWVSIKDYVSSYTIRRVISHHLSLPNSGELDLKIKNYDGKLTQSGGGWSNPSSLLPNGALKVPMRAVITEGGTTYYRFMGFISDWGPTGWANGKWIDFEAKAMDALSDAQGCYMPPTWLGAQYMMASPAMYYPCEDNTTTQITNASAQNFQAGDLSGNNRPGTFGAITGQYTTVHRTKQIDRPKSNLLANTLTFHSYSTTVMGMAAWWFSTICSIDDTRTNITIQTKDPMLLASATDGASGGWAITAQYNASSKQWFPVFTTYASGGAAAYSIIGTTPFELKDLNQLVTLTLSAGTFTLYLNGASQGTCPSTNMASISTPLVCFGATGPGGITYSPWPGVLGESALGTVAVSSATVSNWWSFVEPMTRTTGGWVDEALNVLGPAGADRAIETGVMSLVEPIDNSSGTSLNTGLTTTVRSTLEQIAQDELYGLIFVDGTGTWRFYDQKRLFGTTTVRATLGTATGATPIISADIQTSTQFLYTATVGARGSQNPIAYDGATETTVVGRTGGYGVLTYQLPNTVNVTSDSQLWTQLQVLTGRFEHERVRFDRVKVRPGVNTIGGTTPNPAQLLGLDLWDTINITLEDRPGGSTISVNVLILGITETVDLETGDWTIELDTCPSWNQIE